MSITFITGSAHSGKTTYIYGKIAADAKKEQDRSFYVIVPEQYTLSTQKKLTSLSGGAILNIDVLSFARLTHRIFEELGLGRETVLEDTGKNLLLRRIIGEHENELIALRGDIRRMGYVDEVKSLLTEFEQYRIGADELDIMASEAESGLLSAKLKDMALIKRAFDEKCDNGYITSEQLLEKLALVAAESEKLKDAVFVFDGFTGFTPVQMFFLKHLLAVAGDMYFTLTIEDTYGLRGIKTTDVAEDDLFCITKKCYVSLRNMAVETGVKVNDDIVIKSSSCSAKEDIRFLGDTIYRPGKDSFYGSAENISILKFQTQADELSYVASEIKRMVREENYRYREFAVICGDESYFSLADRIFRLYDVPVFTDEKKSTATVPVVAFLKNVFRVSEKNYSIEAVMDLVRTSLAGVSADEGDLLENYLYANGIKARWKWERTWKDESMNEIRKRIFSVLKPIENLRKKASLTAGEITKCLYDVMEAFGVSDKIYDDAASFEAQGDIARSSAYMSCYEAVVDILDKIYEFLGDEKLDLHEYTEILDAGLDKLTLGVIPAGSDYVTVGDIERSRLSEIKILFMAGVNEGKIPSSGSSGGILSQIERQSINESDDPDREKLPTDRERALSGRFYIMDAVCKPSDRLIFTYAALDGDGKTLKRSYLLDLVERRFNDLKERTATDSLARIESLATCKKYIYEKIQELFSQDVSKEWQGALSAFLSVKDAKEYMERDLFKIFRETYEGTIGRVLASKLYGETLFGSVSNLESFAGCAYSYFLRYGLKLRERDVLEFDNIELGIMLHEALNKFRKQADSGERKWQDMTAEESRELGESVFSEMEHEYSEKELFDSDKDRFKLSMIKDLYMRTIDILGFHLRQGDFVIAGTEYEFDSRIALSDDREMRLKGKADRVDVLEKDDDLYVKVTDFKLYDNKLRFDNVFYGIQLQLMVYIHEAMAKEGQIRGKKPHFGGVFYYEMKDPVVDAPDDIEIADDESELSAEDVSRIEKSIKKEQRLAGTYTDDINVVKAIDRDFGVDGSLVINGGINKTNGGFKYANPLSEAAYAAVDSFVQDKLKALGDEILNGAIAKNPYYKNKKIPCKNCDYRNVCDFDRDDGDDYRWLREMKDPEAIEMIIKNSGKEK